MGLAFILSLYCSDITFVGRPSLKFEKPPFTPPSLCEGRFAGPLQYRVWKSMKGSIYPGTLSDTLVLAYFENVNGKYGNYTETNTDHLSTNMCRQRIFQFIL